MSFIFKFSKYKNAKIANFVRYGKTQLQPFRGAHVLEF